MPRLASSRFLLVALAPSVLVAGLPLSTAGAAVAAPTSLTLAASRTVFVSDLTRMSSVNGWGPAEKDLSNGETAAGDGKPLRLGGLGFAKGLGVHAASDLRYRVPAGCSTLTGVIGVDDSVGVEGSVVFSVLQGTSRIYQSPLLKGSSPNTKISLPVSAGAVLGLVVTDGGNGKGKDHADWADLKFTCTVTETPASSPSTAPTPIPVALPVPTPAPAPAPTAPSTPSPTAGTPVLRYLSDMPVDSSVNGYGPAEKDMSNGEYARGDGNPITLNSVRFLKGLGVHGASDLRFSVPAGCTVFGATVGVDDETGAEGSVVFQVFNGATKVHDSARMTPQSPNGTISIPVTPGAVLRLVVTDSGDGPGKDHADWADARLNCADAGVAAPAPLAPAPTVPSTPTPLTTGGPVGQTGTWTGLWEDQFNGSGMDAAKWSDHEPWENGGYQASDAWYPVPATTNQLSVANGALTLKARRAANQPNGVKWTTASINTRGKFSIPEGATSYTEARLKAPSGNALLPAFWLLGNGTSGTGEGWPINGEIDILEFANNNVGERNSPFASLWFPKDVYTNAPGTWLNATHVSNTSSYVKRPELLDTFHTWGLYRSPTKMEIYIDGVKLATWLPGVAYNGNIPLPPMLFTKAQHIRFSLGVGGGWAGAGFTEPQYQEGDLSVDYVKVWRQ